MLKPIIYIVDKSLEVNHFENLILSIQLKLDGFSFSILNKDLNKVVALVSYELPKIKHHIDLLAKIKYIYNNCSLLNLEFEKVKVIHINEVSTLVPTALFDESKLRAYLSLNHKLLDNERLEYDLIDSLDVINIYSPFSEINDFLIEKYKFISAKHYASVLMKNIFEMNNLYDELKMFVHTQSDRFEITVVRDKKLILYNSFLYTTKEDFIYYILFVAEQLKINPQEFKLEFYGTINPYSDLFKMAYKYIRNISFGRRISSISYSHELKNVNEHSFFMLLN